MMFVCREMMAVRRSGAFHLVTTLLLVALCRAQTENVLKMPGSSYTLIPTYKGHFKEITWQLNRNNLVDLELDNNQTPIWFEIYPSLKAGASLNNQTGALTIPQLTSKDSGEYRAEVKLQNGTRLNTHITLIVLAQAETVLKLAGSDHTLTPTYRGSLKEITWHLNRNNLVELELDENQNPTWYHSFPPLKAGASLNNQTGALTIPHLTTSDSGEYWAIVILQDQTLLYTHIDLTVQGAQETESAAYGRTHVIKKKVSKYRWKQMSLETGAAEEPRSETHGGSVDGFSSGRHIGILIGIAISMLAIIIIIIIIEFIRWRFPNAPCLKHITKCIPPLPYGCKKGDGNTDEPKRTDPAKQKAGDGNTDELKMTDPDEPEADFLRKQDSTTPLFQRKSF